MAKSKYGNSNLYMTPRQLADLVVETMQEQNYFKADEPAHPEDIAHTMCVVAETVGAALSWAISEEHKAVKEGKIQEPKQAYMKTKNLRKDVVLPVDEEIAPLTYSEWKKNF